MSEQISTAGYEASGTGNMKFSMNGALTIGTLDGANVEIRQEVGAENFFLFGLTVEQVQQLRASGYHPRRYYEANPYLREVLDQIAAGTFSGGNRELFRPIVDSLLNHDDIHVDGRLPGVYRLPGEGGVRRSAIPSGGRGCRS